MRVLVSATVLLISGCLFPAPCRGQDRLEAWVTFTDKGLFSDEEWAAALEAAEDALPSRARERRRLRRTRPGIVDHRDIPIDPTYIQGLEEAGANVRSRSRWFNGVSVLATRPVLRRIRGLPFVASVTAAHAHTPKGQRGRRVPGDPDLRRDPPSDADPLYGWSAGQIRQISLDRLHEEGYKGGGTRIAIIDTGFRLDHPAFENPDWPLRIVGQWDFMDHDADVTPEPGDAADQHEHGTLILGILGANLPGILMGTAPEAEYLLLKAEDAQTEFPLEEWWFAAALEYAEYNGADVVSSSLVLYEGYSSEEVDGETSVMAKAWGLAAENGIIGLQGAGNSGYDGAPDTHHMLPPAGVPGILTVGAVDGSGEIASFSSDGFGEGDTVKPEILAWGEDAASISPHVDGAYTTASGTSMATPVLAGGIACLLQGHPEWTLAELRAAVYSTASRAMEGLGPDPLFIEGYGIPNLARAMDTGSQPRLPPGAKPRLLPGALP